MHSYHIEKVLFEEFSSFITETEKDFIPPLLNRIEVNSYYEKLIKNAEFIVCRDNERIIGLICFYCNNKDTREAFITYIAVRKEYRGNNIASNLLNKATDFSREQGMNRITIETNNTIAYKCYIKNGFSLVSTEYLPEYNLNRYILEKSL